ncbi:MAG TPA: hypothetical protein VNO55_16260 [Polyangia bacterium]|nr:hypothetical protein [Polyangia bacterium]
MIAGNSCRLPPAHFKNGAGAFVDADAAVDPDAGLDVEIDVDVDLDLDTDVDAFVTSLDGERARFPGFSSVFCSFFVFRFELSA